MKTRPTLLALARAISDECDRNAPFRMAVENALGINADKREKPSAKKATTPKPHRRKPAVLDPVSLARDGEHRLRDSLNQLDLEQLKDIVAQYGMDTSKLVMKWKEPTRVIDRIVETSLQRAAKGDAFRF